MNLHRATSLYEVAQCCTATRETVEHPAVRRYVLDVRSLNRSIVDRPDDELLGLIGKRARRARWDLHSIPLPLDSSTVDAHGSSESLKDLADRVGRAYGEALASLAVSTAGSLDEVGRSTDCPLGDRVIEILSTGNPSRSAVLVRRGEFVGPISTWLQNCMGSAVRVITQEELSVIEPLETLVILGPSRWYHRYVMGAPRAEQMAFVHFAWVSDDAQSEALLPGAESAGVVRPIRGGHTMVSDLPIEDAEGLVPSIDWDAVVQASRRESEVAEQGMVESNAYVLSGGYSVYLEALEGPRIYVIDLEADGTQRVRNEPTRSVSGGDHLLLRSARGGDDYIRTIANRLLGHEALQLRGLQERWKKALRDKVVRVGGVEPARADLQRLGTRVQNVSYWMSMENIRTLWREDFEILMDYIGLEGQAPTLWPAMKRISDAHTRAGSHLRQLLEAQVLDSDLTELRRAGRMDFELEGVDAGVLSIFRVESRSPTTTEVPQSWLRWPEKLEGDSWLG